MKQRRRFLEIACITLVAALIAGLLVATPARAHNSQALRPQGATALNANIYITTDDLRPLFQAQIDQRAPALFNSAIASAISKLPAKQQTWARQMAAALIQPSVTLTGLKPQVNGLETTLLISLYPGDPEPTTASMLINFKVLNGSTVQVNGSALNGGPALMNGPLTTLQIPIGKLNSVRAAPACGSAALMTNLQYPVTLSPGQNAPLSSISLGRGQASPTQRTAGSVGATIEIPASSLAPLGSSMGIIQVTKNLTAQHINVGAQGSNLQITADIYLDSWLKLGTATTTLAPTAAGGNLAVRVLSTTLTVLHVFTFPVNSYNQQIERTLNAQLNGALAGKFNVTGAQIGPNSRIPCVAHDSLLLTGTTNLGL